MHFFVVFVLYLLSALCVKWRFCISPFLSLFIERGMVAVKILNPRKCVYFRFLNI